MEVKTCLENKAIAEYLRNLIGDVGIDIIKSIPDTELIDEEISKASKINLNLVRKTLFTLYENHLAEYRRRRDNNSGWLTYIWKINISKIYENMDGQIYKLRNALEQKLIFERENVFFACKNYCGRTLFDYAATHGFRCPHCSDSLSHFDNEQLVTTIEEKLHKIL